MVNDAIYKGNLEYFAPVREMDRMTPRERGEALARGDAVDRMPVLIMPDLIMPELMGTTLLESELTPKGKAELQIGAYRMFGVDSVGMMHGLYSLPISLSQSYSDPVHLTRTLERPPMRDIDDVSVLTLENVRFEGDEAVWKAFDAIRYIQDEIGDEIGCGMNFTSPFTVATGMVGVEPFLRAYITKPKKALRILDFVLEAQWKRAEVFLEAGIPVSASDPVASGTVISPRLYRQMAKPYEVEFATRIMSYTKKPLSIHICGDTTSVLTDIADPVFSTFSLDNLVDLGVAKEAIRTGTHLVGNVDPVGTMLEGTTDDVAEAVRDCYRKAWDSPCGFTIDTGCDLPHGTPRKNVYAYLMAAKACARDQAHADAKAPRDYAWNRG